MNRKMTINSQLLTTESKKQQLSKQLEEKETHRYGDHMEGYQWKGEMWRIWIKVQG